MSSAVIFGLAGLELTADERAFFSEVDPWGFILFARNIETPEQVRALTSALREAVGREAPVLIDQEGGRVARLRPPHWRDWPVPLVDAEAGEERLRLRYRLIAAELAAIGIDVDCAPMLDLPVEGTHPIIADRVLGRDPEAVARAGRVVAEALLAGGVLPIIKHIPGHGRAVVDSHDMLPAASAPRETLATTDFAPFRALADLPMAMTGHVVFEAIDPDRPATLSPACIAAIRDEIGFDGLLITDDLSMHALSGPMEARCSGALAAGCDLLLHCNGKRPEMDSVAAEAPELMGRAAERAATALSWRRAPDGADLEALAARYAALGGERAA
ncbi:MAG: glycoside hydrolase family 3 protein [Pseudomonadota bacterium]